MDGWMEGGREGGREGRKEGGREGHGKNWTSSTGWKFYFQHISRIFPNHGKHLHTIMELDKTMETGFSNLCLQYFQHTIFSAKEKKEDKRQTEADKNNDIDRTWSSSLILTGFCCLIAGWN